MDKPLKRFEEETVEVTAEFKWVELIKLVWQYFFLVWLVFTVTFAMLTHVALATEIPEMDYTYFETLIILDYNFFDFLGRNFCALYMVKRVPLWICTFVSFVFWATFIMIASDAPSVDPAWLFSSAWFKFVNMALYAFSNGYVSTLCMIYGPAQTPGYMKDRAGYLMSFGLVFGIFSGTVLAFSFSDVGHIPSD